MQLRYSVALCAATLSSAISLRAEASSGNARALLDAYLAQAALETPSYRADLRAAADTSVQVPPGRLEGVAPILGAFTYRPKTYAELTPAERAALLHDPKLRVFLITTREQLEQEKSPEKTDPPPAQRPGVEEFSLPPEEMLRPRPAFIALPASAKAP